VTGLLVAWLKEKGKCNTLDIAPFREETLLQKRSGMARIVSTPTRLSMNEMSHVCFCLSSRSWPHLPTMEG